MTPDSNTLWREFEARHGQRDNGYARVLGYLEVHVEVELLREALEHRFWPRRMSLRQAWDDLEPFTANQLNEHLMGEAAHG